jgi:hypothetical protein
MSETMASEKAKVVAPVPLYRLYNPAAEDHFYTADAVERDATLARGNYHSEGIAAWVLPVKQPGTAPLYRLYDGNDHFYTISAAERDRATASGYRSDGEVAFVFIDPQPGTVPFRRLRHPRTGNHFYTISDSEVTSARKKAGYVEEGNTGYVYATPPASSKGNSPPAR